MSSPPVVTTRMTFDDEFNSFSSSPNGSAGTWTTTYPFGGETARTLPANHEAEFYSDSSVGENPFSISQGVLNIDATPAAPGSNPYGLPYDSGVITTHDSFAQEYGYFETRVQMPAGKGLWPAFWMIPQNNSYSAELDVFEQLGNDPKTIYSTVHDWAGGDAATSQKVLSVPDTSAGFHVYGVDWEPTTTTFYEDGKALATVATPASMRTPMIMMANLAVGGAGSWPGAPDGSTPFPAAMKIDYVRAYATASTINVSGRAALASGISGPPAPVAPPTPPPVTTPPPTQPPVTIIGSGQDVLALAVAEDAYQGDAKFTIAIDGQSIGGVQTASASHAAGATQQFDVKGVFAPGHHSASVTFLNDLWAGTASTDRNLYLVGSTIDGTAVPSASLALMSAGAQSFSFSEPGAAPLSTPGLVLHLAEDAYQGDAQFTVAVDGHQLVPAQAVTALNGAGASQAFSFINLFSAGTHDVAVSFVNDLYRGTPETDRNLYIKSAEDGGVALVGAAAAMYSNGTQHFSMLVHSS